MARRSGCILAVAVGMVLGAGCTGTHGKTDPAAPGRSTATASASAPSLTPKPTPTKKYSPVGGWTPNFLSASSTSMMLFTVEGNGEVSTFGEPLGHRAQPGGFVICTGDLSSMSMPAKVKVSCLDTADLERTIPPGESLELPEYTGVVDVGEAPPSLKEYGEDMLTIRWSGGQVDFLFKNPYGGGTS